MTRVSQLAQQTLTLNSVLDAQERVRDAQIQIATGRKSQNYAGIAGDASRLVSLESLRVRVNQFIANNTIIEQRLQLMDTSVSAIFDVISDLRTLLIQGLSAAAGGDTPIAAVAGDLLEVVAGQLNIKENGRYIFAGSKTDTQPVQSPVPDPTTFGVPDAGYYNGDSLELTARIDETVTITHGITADRLVFQQAIAALKGAIEGANTNDRALLETSLGLAGQAIQALAGLRAEIGSELKTIEGANLRNGEFLTFIEGVIGDIENVDVAATVARLASDQLVLEASFLTLARITRLSLVNFLD